MNIRAVCLPFVATLFFASAGLAVAGIERTVERVFPVNGAGTLRVETHGGEVRVLPSPEPVVRVTVKQTIRAGSESEADELLRKLELNFTHEGNDVHVTAKYERPPLGFRVGRWPPVQVDVDVAVPAEFATDLRTSGGGVTVGDLGGSARVQTSGGRIKLGRMGGAVDARTSGGGITLAGARGPVELKTSGGSITAGVLEAPAVLTTSGGGITVEGVSGSLRAHTSGGSIRAGITGPLSADSSLSTSGGSLHVAVARDAKFQLDATSSGGGVDAKGLTLTLVETTRNRLAGPVNGGGPLLKLRTSGGSVAVRAN